MTSYSFFKRMDQNLKNLGIVTRPQSANGLWLAFLLPLCFITNTTKLLDQVSFDYKVTTIISFGVLIQTATVYCKFCCEKCSLIFKATTTLAPGALTSFLVYICLKQTCIFGLICGLSTTLLYEFLYFYILKNFPRSFTLGESAVVVQGIIVFLFNVFLQLPSLYLENVMSHTNELTVMKPVLQIGLLGLMVLIIIIHMIPVLQSWILFYPLLFSFIGLIITFPDVHNVPQIYAMIDFITKDSERISFILIFGILVVLAVGTVAVFSIRNLQSTTSVRKIFHVLIILVFVPGLVYQCTLLYVATVIMLAVFCMLETIRIVNLPPLARVLSESVVTFLDEKDAGIVALTPIYLLVGCSMPLWIHPMPCDITDSAGFELLKLFAGVLSVGVGDMAASIIGARFGKHKWPNSSKSVEGTLASIVCQCLMVVVLWEWKLIYLDYLKVLYVGVAVLANALVEAQTNQVDNLVLPLITFCILSLA